MEANINIKVLKTKFSENFFYIAGATCACRLAINLGLK